jgi:hypothetical protein
VCTALEEHLKFCAAAPTDLIFRSPEGGPVRLATWRRRFWAPAVHSAGVEPLRPHDYADIRVMPTFPRNSSSSGVNTLELSA